MLATEHKVQGSCHVESAYYAPDFGYIVQLVNFVNPEPEEAVDIGL